jgi:hypothetical protein
VNRWMGHGRGTSAAVTLIGFDGSSAERRAALA